MSLLKKKISSSLLGKEHLFHFKNHLGSRQIFRNREMDEYLYGFDHLSNSVFDVAKMTPILQRALNFLGRIHKANKQVLFVGTNVKSRKLIKLIAQKTNQPYVQRRWIKGLLTNWENICSSIKFYPLFLRKLDLSKKNKYKLEQTFEGVSSLKSLPSAIFLIDLKVNQEVLVEAKKLNIPIIAIVDNNSNFVHEIDYPIFSNTESVLSLFFIISLVIDIFNKK